MSFRTIRRGFLVVAVVTVVCGCAPRRDNLLQIESYDGSALYLDTRSIKAQGNLVTFKTTLRSNERRWFGKNRELRKTMQIDCRANTWRDLDGGLYDEGRLSQRLERKMSGSIPPRGYTKLLRDRVC